MNSQAKTAKPVKVKKTREIKVTVPSNFAIQTQGAGVEVESADPKWPLSPTKAAQIREQFMRELNKQRAA